MSTPLTRGGITRVPKPTDPPSDTPVRNKASGSQCAIDFTDSRLVRVVLTEDNPRLDVTPPAEFCTGNQARIFQSGPLKRVRWRSPVPIRWENGEPELRPDRCTLVEFDFDAEGLLGRTLAPNLLIG